MQLNRVLSCSQIMISEFETENSTLQDFLAIKKREGYQLSKVISYEFNEEFGDMVRVQLIKYT